MVLTKSLILEIVGINIDNIYIEIDLIEQDIKVLLQLVMVRFEIQYLEIVDTYLIYCLVILAFKDKYLLIFYYR